MLLYGRISKGPIAVTGCESSKLFDSASSLAAIGYWASNKQPYAIIKADMGSLSSLNVLWQRFFRLELRYGAKIKKRRGRPLKRPWRKMKRVLNAVSASPAAFKNPSSAILVSWPNCCISWRNRKTRPHQILRSLLGLPVFYSLAPPGIQSV